MLQRAGADVKECRCAADLLVLVPRHGRLAIMIDPVLMVVYDEVRSPGVSDSLAEAVTVYLMHSSAQHQEQATGLGSKRRGRSTALCCLYIAQV